MPVGVMTADCGGRAALLRDPTAEESELLHNVVAKSVVPSCNRKCSSTRTLSSCVEWCESLYEPGFRFATKDACWIFVNEACLLKAGEPSPLNNPYSFIPHLVRDAVLQSHKQRLMVFYRSTFFDRALPLEFQHAAALLSLRGQNTDHDFLTVEPGGVGQNLNSTLIVNLFGDMHAFIDINIFFTDDELRK